MTLGSDPMRKLFGTLGLNPDAPNGAFLAANRGKRSLEIEVKTEAGQEVLDRLLKGADVLLTNLRPSALERLGLTPEAVSARYPQLIYCSVTAYGWGGPDQERAGYDLAAFFGRAGISHELTTQGTPPAALMQGLGDTFTALAAVSGILAALVERQSTGNGRFVEASLLRTGMWALSGELGVQAMGGHPRPPAPRDSCPTPLFNSYQAGDGRWFFLVGVEASRHLPKALPAIERPDLLSDERFRGGRQISKNRREVIALLDAAFAAKPLAEWIEIFNEHDVWWAPVQSPADVVLDPQARASDAWVTIDQGTVGAGAESVDAPTGILETGSFYEIFTYPALLYSFLLNRQQGGEAMRGDVFALDTVPANAWRHKVTALPVTYQGRAALRVELALATVAAQDYVDSNTFVVVPADFSDGEIEIDLLGKRQETVCGAVGLWVDIGTEGYFANLRIVHR